MGQVGISRVRDKESKSLNVRLVDLISRQDARHRLGLGLAAGAAGFFSARGHLRLWSAAIAGWNAVALVILALDWVTILTTPRRKIRQLAQQQDLSRFLVFLFCRGDLIRCPFRSRISRQLKEESKQRPFHRSSVAHVANGDLFLDAGSYRLWFAVCACVLR